MFNKSIKSFKSYESKNVDTITNNSLVFIEDYNGKGDTKFILVLDSKTPTSNDTISDFLAYSVYKDIGGSDFLNTDNISGLQVKQYEIITETNQNIISIEDDNVNELSIVFLNGIRLKTEQFNIISKNSIELNISVRNKDIISISTFSKPSLVKLETPIVTKLEDEYPENTYMKLYIDNFDNEAIYNVTNLTDITYHNGYIMGLLPSTYELTIQLQATKIGYEDSDILKIDINIVYDDYIETLEYNVNSYNIDNSTWRSIDGTSIDSKIESINNITLKNLVGIDSSDGVLVPIEELFIGDIIIVDNIKIPIESYMLLNDDVHSIDISTYITTTPIEAYYYENTIGNYMATQYPIIDDVTGTLFSGIGYTNNIDHYSVYTYANLNIPNRINYNTSYINWYDYIIINSPSDYSSNDNIIYLNSSSDGGESGLVYLDFRSELSDLVNVTINFSVYLIEESDSTLPGGYIYIDDGVKIYKIIGAGGNLTGDYQLNESQTLVFKYDGKDLFINDIYISTFKKIEQIILFAGSSSDLDTTVTDIYINKKELSNIETGFLVVNEEVKNRSVINYQDINSEKNILDPFNDNSLYKRYMCNGSTSELIYGESDSLDRNTYIDSEYKKLVQNNDKDNINTNTSLLKPYSENSLLFSFYLTISDSSYDILNIYNIDFSIGIDNGLFVINDIVRGVNFDTGELLTLYIEFTKDYTRVNIYNTYLDLKYTIDLDSVNLDQEMINNDALFGSNYGPSMNTTRVDIFSRTLTYNEIKDLINTNYMSLLYPISDYEPNILFNVSNIFMINSYYTLKGSNEITHNITKDNGRIGSISKFIYSSDYYKVNVPYIIDLFFTVSTELKFTGEIGDREYTIFASDTYKFYINIEGNFALYDKINSINIEPNITIPYIDGHIMLYNKPNSLELYIEGVLKASFNFNIDFLYYIGNDLTEDVSFIGNIGPTSLYKSNITKMPFNIIKHYNKTYDIKELDIELIETNSFLNFKGYNFKEEIYKELFFNEYISDIIIYGNHNNKDNGLYLDDVSTAIMTYTTESITKNSFFIDILIDDSFINDTNKRSISTLCYMNDTNNSIGSGVRLYIENEILVLELGLSSEITYIDDYGVEDTGYMVKITYPISLGKYSIGFIIDEHICSLYINNRVVNKVDLGSEYVNKSEYDNIYLGSTLTIDDTSIDYFNGVYYSSFIWNEVISQETIDLITTKVLKTYSVDIYTDYVCNNNRIEYKFDDSIGYIKPVSSNKEWYYDNSYDATYQISTCKESLDNIYTNSSETFNTRVILEGKNNSLTTIKGVLFENI